MKLSFKFDKYLEIRIAFWIANVMLINLWDDTWVINSYEIDVPIIITKKIMRALLRFCKIAGVVSKSNSYFMNITSY